MEACLETAVAVFREGSRVAGEYVLDDPFKPHFRSLLTPAGHTTVVVCPGDHRHHKGLMYALRCADLNFWEENPGTPTCGVQEILATVAIGGGLRQDLLWRREDGALPTYREERSLTCALDRDGRAFRWHWRTVREALRDHRLVKSEWSLPLPDGRKINYHGLGLRLPWMWAFGGDAFTGVEVAGAPAEPLAACGTSGPEVGWWGRIDGFWTPPVAAVTVRQAQQFTWFVLKGDFPYLAVGPSNAEERDVTRGEIFTEEYEIVVEDRPA